jgi:site-specific DNA-methyltransferase (adenine-specific)
MSISLAYNQDCLAAMREMPDKAFDLAAVDPPYGIGVMSMNYTTSGAVRTHGYSAAKRRDYRKQSEWDIKPTQEYFDELRRVSKAQIIWGGNYFSEMLPPSKGFICWDKRVNDQMTNDFSDCEYAWISEGLGVARMFRYCWNGMIQGDMKNKEDRFHPTQKPVALYAWIYSKYAKPGYKILDTHLGSGSSRIAAYDAGLDFVGYEIDKEYFDKQEERYQRHISQISLFVDGAKQEDGAITLW